MQRIPTILTALLMLMLAIADPAAATHQDDCAGGADAGNSVTSAHGPMPKDITCTGAMNSIDSHDWYYVPVTGAPLSAAITVTVCPDSASTLDADLRVYFVNGGVIQIFVDHPLAPGSYEGGSFSGGTACDTVNAATDLGEVGVGGAWFIDVDRFSGEGSYVLDMT